MRIQLMKLEAERPGVLVAKPQLKLSKRAEQARKNLPAVKVEFGPLFNLTMSHSPRAC